LKITSPTQSCSANVKSGIFILSYEAKQPNTIGCRQNSSSSAFASSGKIDTAFWHCQSLISNRDEHGLGCKSCGFAVF